MYCAYDDDKNIIAFHDSKKVVEKYIYDVYNANKVNLELGKIKKSSEYKLEGKDELYLVRFNDTYVQSGYLIYLQITMDEYVKEEQYAKDILLRMLEMDRLDKKQSKALGKAVEVIDEVLYEDSHYVPSLNILKRLKMDYDPYIYNYRLLE
jgi:hypothetical protein